MVCPGVDQPQRRVAWGSKKMGTFSVQLLFSVVIISSLLASSDGHLPSRDFHSHKVINPQLYHGRHKREIASTHSSEEEGRHIHHLTVAWDIDGQDYVLDLKLNRDLIPEHYFEKYHHQGQAVVNKPTRKEIELCHYTGVIRDRPGSWAAVSTCEGGVEGVLYDGSEMHHIQKTEEADLFPHLSNPHYVYNHNHMETNRSCGFHDTKEHFEDDLLESVTPSFFKDPTFNRMLRYKRDISPSKDEAAKNNKINVKGPWNANKRSRFVELVIVVDNRKYKEYGRDLEKVYRKCKDIANIANALYAPLNIYIALVGVDVWSEYDEITLSTNADTTLTNFLHYRRERLVKQFPNDNAQLLTGLQFDSGVVGKALKGPICTYEFSGGVSMWHSEVTGLVATTMAHEMGHNFGMEHDTENCECPDERCIMSPASSTMRPSFWSSCSLEYLALAFEHGMDYCLRNKPRTLFDTPVCGNGFVEPGEECDCGLKDHCDNPCCDPNTCRLFANATCATGECCDFKTCQPKTAGNVCRFAEHECDLPEYCNGTSEFCPKDVFKVDGVSCKVGQAFCYQGTCRTHSDQCRLLWGPSGKKSDNQCYEQNKKGSRHGNCGYNRVNQSYISCHNEDVRCGMLHCQHLNERLEFGMESVAILSHSFINSGGRIIPCRTALVDLGIDDVDPGLAPEGARCGDDSLCVNQKCMPVASLKIGPLSCVNNCNGHGQCNSLGHCHCDQGWAPPHCEAPGPGGSLDSGPASNPDSASGLATALYVLFLFILPLLLIAACITYYIKGDLNLWIQKKSKPDTSGFIKVERCLNHKNRPPSRLNIDCKDISGPVSVDTNNSLNTSPTHALLPRSDTQNSDLSSAILPPASKQLTTQPARPGRFSAGMITGLGGFQTRRKSREDCLENGSSPPDSLATVVTCDQGKINPSYKSRTSNLLKSLNKSISFPSSFPSPKFRTGSKTGSDKYEVKIEPRTNQDDVSPSETNKVESVTTPTAANNAAVDATDSGGKLSPTKAVGSSPTSDVPTSASFSTFSQKSNKSSTLPASMSLSPVEKVDTRVVLDTSKSPVSSTSPSSVVPDFRNNPKLAFPHSSVFAQNNNISNPTNPALPATATQPAPAEPNNKPEVAANKPPSVFKPYEPSWKRQPNPNSYRNRYLNKTSESNAPTSSSTTSSITSSTTPATTVTVSPFSQPPASSSSSATTISSKLPSESSSSSSLSSPAAPAPMKQSESSATVTSMTSPSSVSSLSPSSSLSSSDKPSLITTKDPLKQSNKPPPTVPARPTISKPILQNTTPNAANLIAKAPSTGVSQSSILATKEKSSEPGDPFKPPRDRGRRAMFSDNLTLPSPTSPNIPPIIHQPKEPKDEPVGKLITPTWSNQPAPVAAQVCRIDESNSSKTVSDTKRDKTSPEPGSDKSSFSKLISNVKRTPSLSVADKDGGGVKEKEKQGGKFNSLPRKQKPERASMRNLEISNPILQKDIEHKSSLVPVCRSPDSVNPESGTITSSTAPSVSSPRHSSPVGMKRPAPPPPSLKPAISTDKKAEVSKDQLDEKHKSSSYLPWRTNINKSSKDPEATSPDANVHKVSSSDDIQSYKKPGDSQKSTGNKFSRQRRPASIATSKPARPQAPPPKPPSSRKNSHETSPDDIYLYDDASALRGGKAPLANIQESLSPCHNEPIYDTISEGPELAENVTSPEEFTTPVGSPIFAKKKAFDTISTGSSAAEEDLMKEILKEMHTKTEGESIYSSLMRKDKKNRKKKALE